MNTRANLLLSTTLLVATSLAAPAFADDTTTAPDATTPDVSTKKDLPVPQEPTAEDVKKIGDDRGIIVKPLTPTTKPEKGKATTADNKGTTPARTTNVSYPTTGSHVFGGKGGGLFSDPAVPSLKQAIEAAEKKSDHSRGITIKTIPAKSTKATTTKATTTTVKPDTTKPLPTTTKTPPTAKAVKPTEVAVKPHATKSTASSGEQIVSAWLNKKGEKPHFKDGEKLQVNVAANKDCNLMIFNYDGEQLTQLYPNEYQSSPFVKSGQTVEVGGENCKFAFTAANSSNKASNEKIFVYAYPLESDNAPISIAMAPVENSPFRAAEMTPEKYREMVNRSEVFFSRKVTVTARKSASNEPEEIQLASFEKQSEPAAAPNKIELHLVIDPVSHK